MLTYAAPDGTLKIDPRHERLVKGLARDPSKGGLNENSEFGDVSKGVSTKGSVLRDAVTTDRTH